MTAANLRKSAENSVRISRGKIVTRYSVHLFRDQDHART